MKSKNIDRPLLTIDVGGTTVKYGLWEGQNLTHKGMFTTPQTWQALVDQLKQILNKMMDIAAPIIDGVAVSLPGSVNTKTGLIAGTSAVPYLNGFNIKQALHDQLGVPVSIQNDANCAALAETWLGNAQSVRSVALVVIGTGVGGAIVANNKLLTGHEYFTGEFGYAVMNAAGETLSELASPVKMAQRFNDLNQGTVCLTGEEVFNAANRDNQLAQKCVNEFYQWLSIAVYNLLVSFNPDRLLIGGGVSARGELITQLKQRVSNMMQLHGANMEINIEPCYFKNDANLIGAIYQFGIEHG